MPPGNPAGYLKPGARAPKPAPEAQRVEQAMASRPSINANARRAPQDLSGAAGGQLTGRGGNVQQLGPAAQRRLAAQPPAPPAAPPAWKQLAQQGIAGQGSAAANRAALNGGPVAQVGRGTPVTPPPDATMDEVIRSFGSMEDPRVGVVSMSGGGLQATGANPAMDVMPGGAPPQTMDSMPPQAPLPPPGAQDAMAMNPALPAEIMQRLQTLQAARQRGAGGAPGVAGPSPVGAKPGGPGPMGQIGAPPPGVPGYFQGGGGMGNLDFGPY